MLRLTPRITRPFLRRCISTETTTATSTVVSTAHKLGDMQALGFCNYTPCGLIESFLEVMHCTAGLPWWGSIVATTVITRSLLLPIAIKAHKNTVKLQNLQHQTKPIMLEMQVAKNSQDQEGQKKAMAKMMKLYVDNDVNPVRSILGPLTTAPVFMSVFFALKDMAELPVPSLKEGGIAWFPDLTLADPYYILPTLTSLTFLATIEVGIDGGQQQSEKTKKILRVLGLISLPVMATFPAALPMYWLTNNLYSLGFAAAVKSESICRILNIPSRQKGAVMTRNGVEMPGFMDAFKSSVDVAKSGELNTHQTLAQQPQPAKPVVEKRRSASGSN